MSHAQGASPDQPTPAAPETDNPAPQAVTPYAWKAIWASIVGYALDGFDLLILGFALTAITATFSLSGSEAGSLATITLIGAVVGGVVGGILSDYVGRVRVLTWSVLVFALFTAATGLAPNFPLLALFRFLSGVGLGAEFGIGMTLAAEAWPARLRARATSFVALGWQGGVLLAAIVSAWAIPAIGWRGLFLLGAIPAVFAFVVRRGVDEPELFERRNAAVRHRSPLKLLFADGRTARASLGILVLTSVQNFGYYGVMIWLPGYLSKQYGFSLTKSATWTGVTVLGMALGIVVFGVLADRFGRRPTLLAFQVGAVVSVLAYSRLDSEFSLLVGGAIMGVFVNGMMGGYGALMAELYPTAARATAQNVLFNVGRGIGGFGPVAVGAAAAAWGFPAALAGVASLYVLDILATLFLIPEAAGTELV